MSVVKDKTKKHGSSTPPANDVTEHAAKRKSRRMSKKVTKTVTPKELITAVKEGNLEVINRMLEASPALKKSYTDLESKQTLFHTAIRTGLFSVVDCLISAGVSTLDVDLKFRNALHFLARVKDPPQALIDRVSALEGLNLSGEDVAGATPLHTAIRCGNTRVAESLIAAKGVSIDAIDVGGLTPLHYACHEGHADLVDKLLKAGADASKRDAKGNTPLHYACDTGSIAIGRLLQAKNVDMMAVNAKGDTPLHRAVEKKEENMCGWLVNNGADVVVRYEKRLYEARHKVQTRKYLRQAAREARSIAGGHVGENSAGDDQQHASDSDGEDLKDDPDGMLSLHDHLDTYGFLIGSEKSNQLQAAEHAAAMGTGTGNNASSAAASPSKPSSKGKKSKSSSPANGVDDDDFLGGHVGGPSADALHEREKSQQKLIKKWVKITKMWTEKGSAGIAKHYSHDKLRSLIYKGIPNHVRAGVWRCISGTLEMKEAHQGEYDPLSQRAIPKKDSNQIDLDINRTNRYHFLFKERYGQGQISLFSILRAYFNYDPATGYCQGMSDLTALAMQYIEEEEAFWWLVRFMKDPLFNMSGRFQDGFKDLKRAFYVHNKLLAQYLPRLHQKLTDAEFEPIFYAVKWYLKCFLDALNFDIVLRIWDVFLFEGSDVLYAFVLSLLKFHEPMLLALDPGELPATLPSLKGPPSHITTDEWIKDVKKNPIKPKQLRAWEAEFDAEWPAMQAAMKEEAERKQAEWNKRREKEKEREREKIAAAAASTAQSNSDDEMEQQKRNVEVPNGDPLPPKKRSSKRGSKRKSRQVEAQVDA
jgi:hypothetical protein